MTRGPGAPIARPGLLRRCCATGSSRRTVRTYISRILTKLDAKSRVEIAAEALRQGVSP